jgi:hypothetical protein
VRRHPPHAPHLARRSPWRVALHHARSSRTMLARLPRWVSVHRPAPHMQSRPSNNIRPARCPCITRPLEIVLRRGQPDSSAKIKIMHQFIDLARSLSLCLLLRPFDRFVASSVGPHSFWKASSSSAMYHSYCYSGRESPEMQCVRARRGRPGRLKVTKRPPRSASSGPGRLFRSSRRAVGR